ncbi:unnamed protein product [Calypogeia fissa]
MYPISGPRFKARKIHDYDLCLKCFESSGADKDDYDKMDPHIYLAGRMRRKADQSRNRVPDSAQKNSPNAAIDGAGSTAAAAENSGGNSAPLGLQEISTVVEEGASSTAPSGINNEDVTPPGQPSQGKSAGHHFESKGNSTPTFSHHGTASERDPEASWRTHQALQNYKASTNSNLSGARSGRLNRASVAGPWDYFLSKDELKELLLSKDEHYDIDVLAMAMLQGNIDVIVLLVYALGECDDPPYGIYRSVTFRYPASTENDFRQRIKLAEVTQAVIQHFDAEEPSFMAACVEEFRNHPDYGFLPLEQYLFHFSFTTRFEEVFSKKHKDLFREKLWLNVLGWLHQEKPDGKDGTDEYNLKTSKEEMDEEKKDNEEKMDAEKKDNEAGMAEIKKDNEEKMDAEKDNEEGMAEINKDNDEKMDAEKKDNEKGMDAKKKGKEEEERPGGQAKPDEQEKATENNNTNNELWHFLLKLHDGQGRTPQHVAVDEATELPFVYILWGFWADTPARKNYRENLSEESFTCTLTAPDGSGKLPVHRAAGVESLKTKSKDVIRMMIAGNYLFDVSAEYREVRTHPTPNALAERGVSSIDEGLLSVTNGFRDAESTVPLLYILHSSTTPQKF